MRSAPNILTPGSPLPVPSQALHAQWLVRVRPRSQLRGQCWCHTSFLGAAALCDASSSPSGEGQSGRHGDPVARVTAGAGHAKFARGPTKETQLNDLENTDRHRVTPGASFSLADYDASDTGAYDGDKKASVAVFERQNKRLEELQELLYADQRHKVLIVLQGMDTSGKDGTIRLIFDRTNPIGVKVASFKRPTSTELAHDYLWRVHGVTPGHGEIVIFNRSHYEDVLVVRVDELVPAARWQKRYQHIVDFERMLVDEGTTILKFFLHISKDEQKQRLEDRLADKEKLWKFDKNDLAVRAKWDAYQAAYEEAIARTSSEHAPWYIVPANKKWYRNLVISDVIIRRLEGLGLRYPPAQDLADVKVT